MARADAAKYRSAGVKRAVRTTAHPDQAKPDNSARAARIARLAADLDELANDGLIGDNDQAIDLPAVWGREPLRTMREFAESENLKKAFLTRQSVLQASVSRGQAAALLGLSEQAVTKHLDQGRSSGSRTGAAGRYPPGNWTPTPETATWTASTDSPGSSPAAPSRSPGG